MDQNNDLAMGYVMGRDNGYGGCGGAFGGLGYGGDWFAILIILALLGNGGWGFGGNNGRMANCATQSDLSAGFANNEIMSDLNDILLQNSQGFAAVQQTLCQGFNGIQQTVIQGFHGVDNAVCTLGYNMQGGFNQLSHQLSDCCCQTQRAIDGLKYENAKNTCDIIRAGQDNTREIINYLQCQETQRMRDEIQTLRLEKSQATQNAFIAANQDAQTAELLRRLGRDCPVPAYVVPNPNCCYDYSNFGRQNFCCG
jgi:hypothetical protein